MRELAAQDGAQLGTQFWTDSVSGREECMHGNSYRGGRVPSIRIVVEHNEC